MEAKPSLNDGMIKMLPAYCILALAIGLMNHVMVLPPLLMTAKRDAWISILMAVLPYLTWVAALFFIMRKTNQQPLLVWLKQRYGGFVSGLVRGYFIVYLLSISIMTIKETVTWVQDSYLPYTPSLVLAATLLLVSGFAAYAGLRPIAIASGFLLPFVVLFGDFVLSANLPKKEYAMLTPVMENGLRPVLGGTLYVAGGLAELLIFVLMQHRLQSKVRLWSLWAFALFMLMLIFSPVTGAIAEFGPSAAAKMRYPAFEEWRLVSIGKYIRHVDFLSIHQWLSGTIARTALALFLLVDILSSRRANKARTVWLLSLCVMILVLVCWPISDMQYLRLLRIFYLPGSAVGSTGILLLIGLLAYFSGRSRGLSS